MVPCLDSVRRFCRMRAFFILVLSHVLFLIFGAAVFMALEQPEEIALQAGVQNLRVGFLNENRCVRESSLDNLLKKEFFAGKRGVAVLEAEGEEYSYDFTSSLFFLTTFLTTTGYGSTMPMSDDGKLFLVMYSLLGIPITLLLLSCVTHRLLPWVTHGPVRHIQTQWGLSHQRAALVHAGLLLALTAALFFLLPATILCLLLPDWSFLESLYFCFISLSTIGLGDYLPGQTQSLETRQGLEFATSCEQNWSYCSYLLLGLVFLLVVLETFWELPQARALVRFFSGCWEGQIKGLALDQLVLAGDSLPPLTVKERAPQKRSRSTPSPSPSSHLRTRLSLNPPPPSPHLRQDCRPMWVADTCSCAEKTM